MKAERPDLCDYKDEIHHPNGTIEDRWRHDDYVIDLNKYIDKLQSQLEKERKDCVTMFEYTKRKVYKLSNGSIKIDLKAVKNYLKQTDES